MVDNSKLDVVAVGAHPDDCEIGCGGTLAALVEQGYRVGIIDLTDGEPTPLSDHPDVRLKEAHAAARALGVHERVVLELPNRRLFDSFEARMMLATHFRRTRPSIVIGLGGRTPTASPDHWQAMQIIDAAVFYSRLTKWDDYFGSLPPHKIAQQIYFHLNFDPPSSDFSSNQFVVDISSTLSKKLASIACYKTQFPPEKKYMFDRVEAVARCFGLAAGFAAGERFTTPRMVGVTNLGSFLLSCRD